MSVFHDTALIGAAGQGTTGYEVERSLRFNSSDSAYLSRNLSTGSTTAWSFSVWVKKSLITTSTDYRGIFTARSAANNYAYLDFSDNGIRFANRPPTGTIAVLQTTPVFRDPSAWFHVLFVYDSANATSTDTLRLFVNGTRITTFSSATYPSASQASIINSGVAHYIGFDSQNAGYLDGYLGDAYFIDGQALDPTSFTETDATTGQLIPKAYSGTYGTNGFHLPFSDNSTAAALGTDTSGNSNTWTVNNISVTAGSGNDSLVDTPTSYGVDAGNGGEVRGNYCTLNPLAKGSDITLSNGNLDCVSSSTSGFSTVLGTFGLLSGKWYWEFTANSSLSGGVGIAKQGINLNSWLGSDSLGWLYYQNNGYKYNNGSGAAYGASWASGDVIGTAFDADNGTLTFYKNGVSQGTAYTGLTNGPYFPAVSDASSSGVLNGFTNFGQRPFAYTAPSGFKALCDTNLPAPTIADGSTVMDVKLYTGNGGTQSISGLGFNPDLIWTKARSNASNHLLVDVIRGGNKVLLSDVTDSEYTGNYIQSFDSSGFTINSTSSGMNQSGYTYVAWTWDAGTSTVSNSQGSITSSVRANASAGFSIVSFSSGSAGNYTVGHGLGAKPHFIITKARNGSTFNWSINHISIATTVNKYLAFTTSAILDNGAAVWGANLSDTNSTTFGISSANAVEANKDCIAYCFAPVAGYSSMGSYVGNGSADGPFVFTGFKIRWLLVKNASSARNWVLLDTARSDFNVANDALYPDLSNAEDTGTDWADFLSNGFKVRTSNASYNSSGATYIYCAFAESPFQYARAR